MEFSSLVIMEKDKQTGVFKEQLGSYSVGEGANFVKKLYCVDGEVSLFFDTNKDVEEWEFSAIYDLFNKKAFEELGYIFEEKDDEFNPTWIVKFKFDEEHEETRAIINELCNLIKINMEKVFEDIKGKENEYN
ncbi:DUF6762 family protein [Clostridium tarantellae]|uniref:Uncharacterized protein n=1 Tax=Clostridium tarantellae TaxID=39493 RepID=A0A6I1MMQ3_9CLOT|nr:DUF6762 family protein [Clostridium tarantellae]MPQ44043.1 hypothetical protein [Clostridium tarantellae]